jgi:DeoR family glycerol-3-phosphate regulon repressor
VEFVRTLRARFRSLTVVTHSARNFEELRGAEGFRTILTGGEYFPVDEIFGGQLALETIAKLHVSACFLFPSAVSLRHGAADFLPEAVAVQKAYMAIADRVVIMADSSKFEKAAFLKICDTDASYTYITDGELVDGIRRMYQNNGITLHTDKRTLLNE